MSDIDFSLLDITDENEEKAANQRISQQKIFTNYLEKYRNTYYIVGNLQNTGVSEELKKELEDTSKIKKIGVTWQLLTIDTFAIEDFMRAYNCSITQIATFALRYYLPSFIYDKVSIKCMSLIKKEPLEDNIVIPDFKINSIDEYNNLFNKNAVIFLPRYQGKLESFSWNINKLDLTAVQLFKELYKFSYNSIIQNSIRCFLTEENYKNGEFILRVIKRQDERRKY